jgi:hypothetical protein
MLVTNSSALIVPAQPPATNAAATPIFNEAPKPLIYIPNGWAWVVWTALILALLAAAYFVWRWWRKKPAVVTPPVPAHVRARRRLEQALAQIGEPRLFSILVSGAIRDYLEERFDFHAPDRTTEEFLIELQASLLLTRAQKGSLGEFLASCDLIKFAKYEPTEMELRGLYESALRLVNETEPRLAPANIPPPAPNLPPADGGQAATTAGGTEGTQGTKDGALVEAPQSSHGSTESRPTVEGNPQSAIRNPQSAIGESAIQ